MKALSALIAVTFCGCLWLDHIRQRDGTPCTVADDCGSNLCVLKRCVANDYACDDTPGNHVDSPVIYFTDIESGPVTGGEENLGVFVTLYGKRFGSERGDNKVLIGEREVARYVRWNALSDLGDSEDSRLIARGLERITVQLGSAAETETLRVIADGRISNRIRFKVRPGNIWFVDGKAAPGGDGSIDAPFAQLYDARAPNVGAGDVVYIRGGVRYESLDPDNAAGESDNFRFTPRRSATGTEDEPIAYVGYPGEFPQLGGVGSRRIFAFTSGVTDYTFAGLDLGPALVAVQGLARGLRFVGNRSSAPIESSGSIEKFAVLGNLFTATAGMQTANSARIEVAYNELVRPGIAFSIEGDNNTNVEFHNNLVRDGTAPYSVSFSGTCVECTLHDNLFIAAGTAAAVRIGALFVVRDKPLDLSMNTFAKGAAIGLERAAAPAPGSVSLRGNILSSSSAGAYFVELGSATAPPPLDGFLPRANFYDNSVMSAVFPFDNEPDARINNPLYNGAGSNDYRLTKFSPALDFLPDDSRHCADFLGVHRHRGNGTDAGAFEL